MKRSRPASGLDPRRPTTRPRSVIDKLNAAIARRTALLNDPLTNVCRVFNGAADGLDGLVLEQLGDVLIAQLHLGRLALAENLVRQFCEEAARQLGARAVYRKVFPRNRTAACPNLERLHRDPTPWIGEPVEPESRVAEGRLTFLVRPYDGYATGLFLDHRTHRDLVRRLAGGQRVLNIFAYTAAFTVAAARGGAKATVSVDVSKKYLEWGKRNLAANDIPLAGHRFICSDVFDYYRRAARQGQSCDLLILDPPTFGRSREPHRVFAVAEDLDRLVGGALPLLRSRGRLLLSVNHRGTSLTRLEQAVAGAAQKQGRTIEALEHPAPPEDFHGDPEAAKSILVQLR